jgi:hypothetical protein
MKYRIAKKIVTAVAGVIMGSSGHGLRLWTDSQIREAYRVFGKRHGRDMTLGADFIIFTRRLFRRMAKNPPNFSYVKHTFPITN